MPEDFLDEKYHGAGKLLFKHSSDLIERIENDVLSPKGDKPNQKNILLTLIAWMKVENKDFTTANAIHTALKGCKVLTCCHEEIIIGNKLFVDEHGKYKQDEKQRRK